jgi:hypothetical protein
VTGPRVHLFASQVSRKGPATPIRVLTIRPYAEAMNQARTPFASADRSTRLPSWLPSRLHYGWVVVIVGVLVVMCVLGIYPRIPPMSFFVRPDMEVGLGALIPVRPR